MVGQGCPRTGQQAEPHRPYLLATAHVEWFWLHTSSWPAFLPEAPAFPFTFRPTSVRPISKGSISCWFLLVLWSAARPQLCFHLPRHPHLWPLTVLTGDSTKEVSHYWNPSTLLSGLN